MPLGAEQMIVCLLEQLLITLLRDGGYERKLLPKANKTANFSEDKFDILDKWIKENIDSNFTIMNLCSNALLNKTALEELFKEKTGLSPHQYLTALRIRKACRLLEDPAEYSVAEVAEVVGLDQRNFSRLFSVKSISV